MPAVDTGLAASPGRGNLFAGNWNGPARASAPGDDFDTVMQATLATNSKSEGSTETVCPPHEPRGSRREEAQSEIAEAKSESPHVGCYSSGVQRANAVGTSLPELSRFTVPACGQSAVDTPRKSRSASVPAASSPSVSLGDETGRKAPPPPTAGYGHITLAPVAHPDEPVSLPESRPEVLSGGEISPKDLRPVPSDPSQASALPLPMRGNPVSPGRGLGCGRALIAAPLLLEFRDRRHNPLPRQATLNQAMAVSGEIPASGQTAVSHEPGRRPVLQFLAREQRFPCRRNPQAPGWCRPKG